MNHNSKKIIVTGGSGFLGTEIIKQLFEKNFKVVVLDLHPPQDSRAAFMECNLAKDIIKPEWFEDVFSVINLAGAPIFGKWTKEYKQIIYDSRVVGTRKLVDVIKKTQVSHFVSASAVGVYGDRGNEQLDEQSDIGDIEKSFLTHVSHDWEEQVQNAKQNQELDVTIIRNGHILGEAGLVGVLKPYYQWGIGGPLGNGKQFFPWIHVEDCAHLYVEAATTDTYRQTDVINAVAPEQITNKTFSKVMAKVLRRPHIFFIPEFALRILYKDLGKEMMYSQNVVSSHTLSLTYKKIEETLKNILVKG